MTATRSNSRLASAQLYRRTYVDNAGDYWFPVYTPDAGVKIHEILSPIDFVFGPEVLQGTEPHDRNFGNGEIVNRMRIIADTDGNEAGTKTRAILVFNPVKISVRTIPPA